MSSTALNEANIERLAKKLEQTITLQPGQSIYDFTRMLGGAAISAALAYFPDSIESEDGPRTRCYEVDVVDNLVVVNVYRCGGLAADRFDIYIAFEYAQGADGEPILGEGVEVQRRISYEPHDTGMLSASAVAARAAAAVEYAAESALGEDFASYAAPFLKDDNGGYVVEGGSFIPVLSLFPHHRAGAKSQWEDASVDIGALRRALAEAYRGEGPTTKPFGAHAHAVLLRATAHLEAHADRLAAADGDAAKALAEDLKDHRAGRSALVEARLRGSA